MMLPARIIAFSEQVIITVVAQSLGAFELAVNRSEEVGPPSKRR